LEHGVVTQNVSENVMLLEENYYRIRPH